VFLEARLAKAGATMEFPIVPGTNDVVAVETPLPERTAHVIARVRHGAEAPVAERDRERAAAGGHARERHFRQFVDRADVNPSLLASHGALPTGSNCSRQHTWAVEARERVSSAP